MKKTIVAVLLITAVDLLLPNLSLAQTPVSAKELPKVSAGIELGANYEELNGSSVFAKEYTAGFTGGIFAAVTEKKIGVSVEVIASSTKLDYAPAACLCGFREPPTSVKMNYINVPLLFEYKVIKYLWVQGGPQFSDLLTAKTNLDVDVKSGFKPIAVGAVLGLQATLPFHFTASARYIFGLTNLNNAGSSDWDTWGHSSSAWSTSSLQVAIGYRIM